MKRPLWILVEGDDDETFFRKVVQPRLVPHYSYVKFWQYAGETGKRIASLLNSVRAMNGEYLFVSDLDNCLCVTQKKGIVLKKYPTVENSRSFVVVKEIESWYLAGLEGKDLGKFGLPSLASTAGVDKQQFDSLIPPKFTSRIDY